MRTCLLRTEDLEACHAGRVAVLAKVRLAYIQRISQDLSRARHLIEIFNIINENHSVKAHLGVNITAFGR